MINGFTQFVIDWAKGEGLDQDLALYRMGVQVEFAEAKGTFKANATPQVIGEWLMVAAREAGLFERR